MATALRGKGTTNLNVKRLTRISLFTTIALIMNIIENSLPPLLAFAPGAKMGLSNVVTLIALIILGTPDAYIILVARCLIGSLFSGSVMGLMYSLPSGLISLTAMILLYKLVFPKMSLMGISFVGAMIFNIVQVIVASLVVGTFSIMALLPLMTLASLLAGLFVGIVAYYIIKYLPYSVYRRA